jgi:hypothetical protein
MMKRLLVLAALCSSAFASAQGIGSPVNLSFRAGFVYSLDEFTRDTIGSSLIGFGADYYLERGLFENGETFLSFDWIGRGLNGDKGNMFPICLNHRWYTGGDFESANRRYYFIGAGVAIIDVVSTNTVAAVRLGVGAELGQHIFGELSLVYSDASSGARASSVGAYLGYRF